VQTQRGLHPIWVFSFRGHRMDSMIDTGCQHARRTGAAVREATARRSPATTSGPEFPPLVLVYANLTGLFGTLLMGGLVQRLAQRGHSLRLVVPVGIAAFTVIGGLLAQALLVPLGFASAQNFWPEYLDNLRAATPLALMFGLGAFVHASLQTRVATRHISFFAPRPHAADGRAQREQVAVHAETGDLALNDLGEHRVVPERLARVDVRHVQLDDRAGQDRQRISQPVAVVRPCASVDQDGIHLIEEGLVDAFDHLAFVVGLKVLDIDAKFPSQRDDLIVDLVERDRPVLLRITLAEHVVVDAMEHEDLHEGFPSIDQPSVICAPLRAPSERRATSTR
jgi:hypothetical protein